MDPLSSLNELSPLHMGNTPMAWMTPADMKLFLCPADEDAEEVWKKAITILCYVVTILRECCELTEFRQTSFGSTYMTLLGFARSLKVSTPIKGSNDDMNFLMHKSREGLHLDWEDQSYLLEQWDILKLSLCKIRALPLALWNRALFEGENRVKMRIKFSPPPTTPEFLTKDFPSATRSRTEILTKENLVGAKTAPTAVSRTFTPFVRRIRFP